MSKAASVEAMANACVDAFGGVDVWINNAGSNGYKYDNLEEADPSVLEEVVLTNSLVRCFAQGRRSRRCERRPGEATSSTWREQAPMEGDA